MSKFLDKLDFHMGEGRKVILDRPLRFEYKDGVVITIFRIPAGFVNDLASVPLWARSLAPPWQESARAGVLHDFLYRKGGHNVAGYFVPVARRFADQLFKKALLSELKEALLSEDVSRFSRFRAWARYKAARYRAYAMYRAVRWFGKSTWDKYRQG